MQTLFPLTRKQVDKLPLIIVSPVILPRLRGERLVHRTVDSRLGSANHRLEEEFSEEVEGPVDEGVDGLVNMTT